MSRPKSSARLRILVSGRIGATPYQGGATWAVLQYLFGLRSLGHDVWFVERLVAEDVVPFGHHRPGSVNAAYCDQVLAGHGFDGRWSLLDHFDSDGRRFVVAHRNDARVADVRGLTLRERQVLAYAGLGHSNKVIAYELGLSTSTVSTHLARARKKMRLPLGVALNLTVSRRTESLEAR